MPKVINTGELIKMATGDFILTDGRGPKFVYHNSKPAQEILSKGKEVISKIGAYLKDLDKTLEDCLTEEIIQVKRCWILVLYDLNGKQIPQMNMSIHVIHFYKWVEWSSAHVAEKQ